VRDDLIRILSGLIRRRAFDGILLETTDLADPAPVARTFFVDDEVLGRDAFDLGRILQLEPVAARSAAARKGQLPPFQVDQLETGFEAALSP
jgi:G3E family GTPase